MSSAFAQLPDGKALATRDKSVRTLFEEGVTAYTDAELITAERIFRQLSETEGIEDSDREIFAFMIGKCLYQQGEYAFCLRHFDKFRVDYPASPYRGAAHITAGHCAYKLGDYAGAAQEYVAAAHVAPDHHREIAIRNLEPLIRRGLTLRELERVQVDLPEDSALAAVQFWLGERYQESGRLREAVARYTLAMRSADETLRDEARRRRETLTEPGETSLKLGLLLPLSGDFASYGETVARAAQLAAQQYGRAVEIIPVDTQGDPIRALRSVDTLVDIGCHAVIGPFVPECIAATVAALRAADLIQILPVSRRAEGELTTLSPRLFTMTVPPERQARQLFATVAQADSMQRFAALIADTPEGHAAGSAFANAALAAGATIYPIHYFTPATLDFTRPLRQLKRIIRDDREEPLLTPAELDRLRREEREERKAAVAEAMDSLDALMAADTLSDSLAEDTTMTEEERILAVIEARWRAEVDGILIWADPEDIRQLIPQLRALGFAGRFIGNAGWGEPALRDAYPVEIDSVVFVSDQLPQQTDPDWRDFVSDYRARFGQSPEWLAGRVFDAVRWLAGEADAAGDPLSPLERMTTVEAYDGAGSIYRFSADRQPTTASVYRYVHGRPVRLAGQDDALVSQPR